MEVASNKNGHARRGRKAQFSDEHVERVRSATEQAGINLKSRKQLIEYCRMWRAQGVLERAGDRFRWIIDPEAIRNSEPFANYRKGQMSALGAIEDEELMVALATVVNRDRLGVKETRELCRRAGAVETRKKPKADAWGLCRAMLKAVEVYAEKHEGVDDEMLYSALMTAGRIMELWE